MAKSMVEKYEQILSEDPGSMVFVELAKALIDRGEHLKAVEVCKAGLEHHPESVVGRVLWGKALISSGKPVEAMEQFDQATAIDKENPYAYNLIGEVLLHKGLYRSAVPILKKAVALQPNDNRVRQWLDQAQRALSGAAPEAKRDDTIVDSQTVPTNPGMAIPTAVGAPTTPGLEATIETRVPPELLQAGRPTGEVAQAPKAEAAATPAAPVEPPKPEGETVRGLSGVFESLSPDREAAFASPTPTSLPPPVVTPTPMPANGPLPERAPDPFTAAMQSAAPTVETPKVEAPKNDVIQGITGVFDALSSRDGAPGASAAAPKTEESSLPPATDKGPTTLEIPAAAQTPTGGLLGDLPLPEDEAEKPAPPAPAPAKPGGPPPLRRAMSEPNVQISAELMGAPPPIPKAPPLPKKPGMLDDLPDADDPPRISDVQKVVVDAGSAEEIAREYERELREKLLAAPPPTFWRKNWLKVAVGGVLAVSIAIGGFIYLGTRRQNRGNDLIALRSKAWQALTLDTPFGYRAAEDLADQALALAKGDVDAEAARALANAELFVESREPGRKQRAEAALPLIKEKHPGAALVAAYLVGETATAREDALKAMQAAGLDTLQPFERALVQAASGEAMLAVGNVEEAVKRLESAKQTDPGNVRALVALGRYALVDADDAEQARKFFERAVAASPAHLPALLGLVSAKLKGDKPAEAAPDFDKALAAWTDAAGQDRAWPQGFKADLDLAEGRVLAAQGKQVDAVTKLAAGATEHKDRAADFYEALGTVESLAGNYDKAEQAFTRGLEQRPQDGSLREDLVRALIARGKYADALKKAQDKSDDRRFATLRGIARFESGDTVKAREDLLSTRRDNKMPLEAAVYLAMLDAQNGQRESVKTVLERAAKGTNARLKSTAQVGLGRVLMLENRRAEAIASFLDAANDPRDWEGACSVGRLMLEDQKLQDAKRHLTTAVARNRFHHEARLALGQALLTLGEPDKAKEQFAAVIADRPDAAAHRGLARALLALGDLAEAKTQAQRAIKLEPRNNDGAKLLGQIALAAGDAQMALKSLERAAASNPRDPNGWSDLGETLVKVGNTAAAKKAFDVALKVDKQNLRAQLGLVHVALPKGAKAVSRLADSLVQQTEPLPPGMRARALALQSRVLLALNAQKKAKEVAQKAVDTDDTSADAHFAMALVAKATRDQELGLKELSRTVALDPVIAEAHLALADSLARDAAQHPKALAELDAYLRIAPNGPDAAVARKAQTALRKRLEQQ